MPPSKGPDPSSPDHKLRKALFLAQDRVGTNLKNELHSLLDQAPAPIAGRDTTNEEIQQRILFKDKARDFLQRLPPETGLTYEALMEQVDTEMAKRKSRRSSKPSEKKAPAPKKNGTSRKRPPGKQPMKKADPTRLVDYLCLLDFMATCNDGPPPKPQEIIEFPAILLNVETGKVEGKFHCYVSPDAHPILSSYCTELTGITQDQVDSGISLMEALDMHKEWLDEHGLISLSEPLQQDENKDESKKTFLFATCGDWDLKVCLPNQVEYHKQKLPASFQSWVNIKWPFENMYHKKVRGIADMLNEMGLQPESRTNTGLDDCLNLAHICQRMIQFGWMPNPTAGEGRIGTQQFWQVQSRRPWPPQPDPVSPYKMIYLIRHGQAEADLVHGKDRSSNADLKDCGLTEQGIQESKGLLKLLAGAHLENIELVVTSPLKRALQTSLLAFPERKIVVNYDLAEIGRDTPENSPKPMEDIVAELGEDIKGRKEDVALDYKTLKPQKWPQPPGTAAPARRVHNAFEWIYVNRSEQTIAVVCHSNVIRTAIYGASAPVAPDNACPIRCQLFVNGNLIPV